MRDCAGVGTEPALKISTSTYNSCSLRSEEIGCALSVSRVYKEKGELPLSYSFQFPNQCGKNMLIDNVAVEDGLLAEHITEQSSD